MLGGVDPWCTSHARRHLDKLPSSLQISVEVLEMGDGVKSATAASPVDGHGGKVCSDCLIANPQMNSVAVSLDKSSCMDCHSRLVSKLRSLPK